MTTIQCDYQRHALAILAIFNDAIANSTALYDYKPRTMEMMAAWFEAKSKGKYPVIGAVQGDAGELMGFASYGPFRAWPAYKYTVEHSVYVDARFRGRGIGKRLMKEIIAAAQGQNYHTMVGVIDSSNMVSIRLHEAFGFECCGTVRQAGFKFGRWLDVLFYQLILPTPSQPTDG
jgi:phosphinothricin acetyltransferase